jgi:hypothetical protein
VAVGRPHALEHVLERRLAAVRRAQAALEQAALVGEGDLLLDREVLGRELGVRDRDRPDALLECAVHDREDVLPAEVTCGEDHAVAGNRPEDRARLRQQRAVLVADRHRLDREPEAAQLVLELRPERHLVTGLRLGASGGLGGRVDRRQPDDPRALARRDLDRKWVHPADSPVQRDRPNRLNPWNEAGDDLGALSSRGVVRLEPEPGEPGLGETVGERHVVDDACGHVGGDVDVQVVAAADELPCAFARH